jgi:hypothetical protein
MNKMFGGIEASTALQTHPKGAHDLKELESMTKAGLDRLYDFQHADGGWGGGRRRKRSFHDGLCRLGNDTRAKQGSTYEQMLCSERPNFSTKSWLKKKELRCTGLDASCVS